MGIFDNKSDLFTEYGVTLVMREKLIGGTPRDPKLIQGWLRKRMGLSDEQEIAVKMRETLEGLGMTIGPEATLAEMAEAAEHLAGEKQTTGFKLAGLPNGRKVLIIEGRQVKAMLKELTNILFAGEKWGTTRKGPKSYVAERVFVPEESIPLFNTDDTPITEPHGIEMMIGHVVGPTGPRSTLGYHEFVKGAKLHFTIRVAADSVPHEAWPDIWVLGQENGLGATRSQGFGKFDIERFEVLKKGREEQAVRVKAREKSADDDEGNGTSSSVKLPDTAAKNGRGRKAAVAEAV